VALRMAGLQAEVAKVTLGIEPDSTWFHLRADQRRVIQVLLNLLSNAIKYTPEGGRVSIRGDVTVGGAGLLVVRDTGIGIAADDLKRLGEPFVQLESTMTRRFGGSGLGLAIARALVEMHGGRIAIDSELGGGTTVTIAFPPDRVVAQ
jgi:two-component system cell cycle sensor histidine kinase PleC